MKYYRYHFRFLCILFLLYSARSVEAQRRIDCDAVMRDKQDLEAALVKSLDEWEAALRESLLPKEQFERLLLAGKTQLIKNYHLKRELVEHCEQDRANR